MRRNSHCLSYVYNAILLATEGGSLPKCIEPLKRNSPMCIWNPTGVQGPIPGRGVNTNFLVSRDAFVDAGTDVIYPCGANNGIYSGLCVPPSPKFGFRGPRDIDFKPEHAHELPLLRSEILPSSIRATSAGQSHRIAFQSKSVTARWFYRLFELLGWRDCSLSQAPFQSIGLGLLHT